MKIKTKAICMVFIMTALISGCADKGVPANENESSKQFYAMDTVMNITAYGENAEDAVTESEQYINALEKEISRTDKNSEIYALNESGKKKLSDDTADILKQSLRLAELSGGYFEPTVAPLSDLWQIGTDNAHIPPKSEIKKAKSLVGYDRVKLNGHTAELEKGMKIDMGGIGKGYAADHVVDIMQKHGIKRAVIALGGNVYVMGQKAKNTGWKVGITDPDNPSDYLGVLEVSDTSIVTSGDYERYFEQDGVRYCHIFDAQTGYPAQTDIRSVTIIDKNSTKADALTTALFVMGYEKAEKFCRDNDIAAVFVLSDHTIQVMPSAADYFTLQSNNYTQGYKKYEK